MLQNNKGYVLLECIMALLLFSSVSSISLHVLVTTYEEAVTTKQLNIAVEAIDRALNDLSIDESDIVEKMWEEQDTFFSLKLIEDPLGEGYNVCVEFEGENHKVYKKCGSHL